MSATFTAVQILPEDFRLFLGSPGTPGCGRPFVAVDLSKVTNRFALSAIVVREYGQTHCTRCRNVIEARHSRTGVWP